MNISPLKTIPVSYVVLPTDTMLYYVQSVLRDTATSKILQTINLKRDSTYLYRYTGTFAPVSDPSGLGRYIDITVIPYTDSGHTTPSQNYAALQLNYVVLQPWIPSLGAGGGGSIDYDKLRITIAEVVEEKVFGSAKDVKKGLNEIPKVEYERIGEDMREALREMNLPNVSHIKSLEAMLGYGSDFAARSLNESHAATLERLEGLEGKMLSLHNQGSLYSDFSASEIKSLISSMKEEFTGLHNSSTEKLGKEYGTKMKEAVEQMKVHLDTNLSEKEVKLRVSEFEPRKKNEPVQIDPDIMKLFA